MVSVPNTPSNCSASLAAADLKRELLIDGEQVVGHDASGDS